MSIEFRIAKRYLRSPRKEGFVSVIAWLSFLGITLGVATLIIVMSVMNGFRAELLSRIVGMRGHVIVQGFSPSFPLDQQVLSKIKENCDVDHAFPIIEKQGIALFKSQVQGVSIKAYTKEDLAGHKKLQKAIDPNDLASFKDNSILIGKRLAERLGVGRGDVFCIMTGEGNYTPFGTIPKQHKFKIVGIFELGMYEYDKSSVFIPLTHAQKIFSMEDKINFFEVFAKETDQSAKIALNLQSQLKNNHVMDWRHSDSSFFQAVEIERNVMFVILSLIIMIASLNVISGLIILVKDKKRDVGLLRTMGMSRFSIMKIFFITGASIGVVGTFFGCFLGVLFTTNIESIRRFIEGLSNTNLFRAEVYFLTNLPYKIDINEVVMIVCIALFLSFISTLYPAWKASKMNPVDCLK